MLLVNVPPGVVTVTNPEVAPLGTMAVRKVPDLTVAAAGVPLNETVVVDVKPCPRTSIVSPTGPE